jgi:CheY-like chemotaxis protein
MKADASSTRAQIIIVLDDEATRTVIQEFLTDGGYQVRVAEHGQAALDFI